MGKSALETQFNTLLNERSITGFTREHKFHSKRRWRFDFAWVDKRVAVEIEGGVWSGGRHTRGSGFVNDCDKYNQAVLDGWAVLRLTTNQLKRKDETIAMLESLLASR